MTGFWRAVVLSEKLLSKTLGWALPDRGRPELNGSPLPGAPAARTGEEYPVLAHDGALCWMQDPRAVVCKIGDAPLLPYSPKGAAHNRGASPILQTVAGWMTRDGKLVVGSWDHDARRTSAFVLRERWGRDDHNSPALLVLSDRRIAAFYSMHNGRGLFCRTTTRPEDISSWDDEAAVSTARRITYPNPVRLDDEGLYYCFWRGTNWKPTFATSADLRTWTPPATLIEEKGREGFWVRPYVKVAGDGKSAIHFAFTDGHPRNEPANSIYYLRYERGKFFAADGRELGSIRDLPMRPRACEIVYDARATGVRAWIWDLALDATSLPVIAYTRLSAKTDHRYHYARFDGTAWTDVEITPAGGWFPETPRGMHEHEPHYSGGLALDPVEADVVYLSRPVRGVFEIEKWTTRDRGRSWTSEPLTSHSQWNNVRPVVPRGCAGNVGVVLWMHGPYTHYTDFRTDIRVAAPADK